MGLQLTLPPMTWPDMPIKLYGSDALHEGATYFNEAVLGPEQSARRDYTGSADESVLAQAIRRDANGLSPISRMKRPPPTSHCHNDLFGRIAQPRPGLSAPNFVATMPHPRCLYCGVQRVPGHRQGIARASNGCNATFQACREFGSLQHHA